MSKRLAAFIVAFSSWSCGASSDDDASGLSAAYLAISPARFEGVECVLTGNGMKRYTATLVDVSGFETDMSLNFELPTSPPTACNAGVRFASVVPFGIEGPGHRYIAKIAGYDREDVEAVAPGSPVMAVDGAYVAPLWVGTCGVTPGNREAVTPVPAIEAGNSNAPDAGSAPAAGGDQAQQTPASDPFVTEYSGPAEPVPGRTVTLRNCQIEAAQGAVLPEDSTGG